MPQYGKTADLASREAFGRSDLLRYRTATQFGALALTFSRNDSDCAFVLILGSKVEKSLQSYLPSYSAIHASQIRVQTRREIVLNSLPLSHVCACGRQFLSPPIKVESTEFRHARVLCCLLDDRGAIYADRFWILQWVGDRTYSSQARGNPVFVGSNMDRPFRLRRRNRRMKYPRTAYKEPLLPSSKERRTTLLCRSPRPKSRKSKRQQS